MSEWRIILILMGIAGAAVAVFVITKREPLPCVTHVPHHQSRAENQCDRGAKVQVVDHVALCVCPPAHTEVSDGDE